MNATALLRLSLMPAMVLSTALLCAACSKPEPPPTDQQPEPQADAGEYKQYKETHTELNDAIQRPINKAQGVESTALDAADKQRAEIEAQTGG